MHNCNVNQQFFFNVDLPKEAIFFYQHLWSIFQSSIHIMQITIFHMLDLCGQLFPYSRSLQLIVHKCTVHDVLIMIWPIQTTVFKMMKSCHIYNNLKFQTCLFNSQNEVENLPLQICPKWSSNLGPSAEKYYTTAGLNGLSIIKKQILIDWN